MEPCYHLLSSSNYKSCDLLPSCSPAYLNGEAQVSLIGTMSVSTWSLRVLLAGSLNQNQDFEEENTRHWGCQAHLVPLLYSPIWNYLKLCLRPSKFIEVSRWSFLSFKHSYFATWRVKIIYWGNLFNSWGMRDFRTLCSVLQKDHLHDHQMQLLIPSFVFVLYIKTSHYNWPFLIISS